MISKKLVPFLLSGFVLVLLIMVPTSVMATSTMTWSQPQSGIDMPSAVSTCGIWGGTNTTIAVWITVSGTATNHEIQHGTGDVLDMTITEDTHGNMMVMWTQDMGNNTYNIFACYYNDTTGWGTATQVQSGATAFAPHVGFDADGNAMAAFEVKVGDSSGSMPGWPVENYYNLFACRYTVGSGWGEVQEIENGTAPLTYYWGDLAVSANGDAIAIWSQVDAFNTIEVCAMIAFHLKRGGTVLFPFSKGREMMSTRRWRWTQTVTLWPYGR